MMKSVSQLYTYLGQDINQKPGIVVHACNPSTWEAEAGGSQV
jgi:hypothetical protein